MIKSIFYLFLLSSLCFSKNWKNREVVDFEKFGDTSICVEYYTRKMTDTGVVREAKQVWYKGSIIEDTTIYGEIEEEREEKVEFPKKKK